MTRAGRARFSTDSFGQENRSVLYRWGFASEQLRLDKLMESTFYVVPKFKKDVGSTTNVPFAVSLASLQEKRTIVDKRSLVTLDKVEPLQGNASVCFTSGSEKMMLMKIAGGMNSKVRSECADKVYSPLGMVIFGGGMEVVPTADPTSGKLEVVILQGFRWYDFIFEINTSCTMDPFYQKKYFQGGTISHQPSGALE
ncbi:hypothetical protein HPP92_025323 [Vanilla planifolia]|uniref:Uncharacterized protein n=1 Tax=Vanilla planifolia TaxID=51239 RepID=A0A835PLQ2_VANPL|nr:hypothetical protein HPP92_025323 [Vanilla planifolia]